MIDRTRSVILDAAARVLGRRPDAAMADIAEEAGIGRATLYRYFPTRESLLRGVGDAGIAEVTEAFAAANLDGLPVDHGIARITSVCLRFGAKYAAMSALVEEDHTEGAKQRTNRPVQEAISRGVREGVLRDDLPCDVLVGMYSALVKWALSRTLAGAMTPEEAAEAVVTVFLDGARG